VGPADRGARDHRALLFRRRAVLSQGRRAFFFLVHRFLPPTIESAFHIAEFARHIPRRCFSFFENVFHIAKFDAYVIEK
jgi:hypothetical protein